MKLKFWKKEPKFEKLRGEFDDDVEVGDSLVKGGKKRDKVPRARLIAFLKPLLWPVGRPWERFYMALSLFFMIVSRVLSVTSPLALKWAVDSLTAREMPTGAIILYVSLRVGKSLCDQARSAVFGLVQLFATRKAAVECFAHLHELNMHFHLNRQTGGVMRSMDRGADAVTSILNYLVFNLVPTFLELGIIIVILFAQFDFWQSLIVTVMLALYVVFTYRVTEWRTALRRSMNELQNQANNRATDSLLNFETVKCFTSEDFEVRRYDNAYKNYNKSQIKVTVTLAFLNFGQQFLLGLGMLTSLLLLASQSTSVDSTYSTGDFVMLNAYILQVAQPLFFLGSAWRFVKNSLVDIEALIRLADESPQLVDKPGARALMCDRGAVTFRDVQFGYDSDRQILKGISFSIPAGKSLAIVGHTGAGKSTISKLLLRFYDVDDGAVLVDDQDVRDVTQKSLRQQIAVVPQQTVLFNDTIRYNIMYGNRNASENDMIEAVKAAQLYDFIMGLPKQFETLCGERGLRLSGGELQRVAIARALIKQPRIMVFDEATSSLDTSTERALQQDLERAAQGRTSLTVAHRLSTVVRCDEIIVLDQGTIVERGSHQQLMARGQIYAEMWQKQRVEEELAVDDDDAKDDDDNDNKPSGDQTQLIDL